MILPSQTGIQARKIVTAALAQQTSGQVLHLTPGLRSLRSAGIKLTLLACLFAETFTPTTVFALQSNIDLATNFTSNLGFSIVGASSGDHSGCSVASAGDAKKDGYGVI